eukprot:1887499-Prymnesium_polylepis.1
MPADSAPPPGGACTHTPVHSGRWPMMSPGAVSGRSTVADGRRCRPGAVSGDTRPTVPSVSRNIFTVNVCVRRTGHTRVDATQQIAGPAGLKCTSSTRAPA